MPLFSDLKRVFFGAKSVAKHQASKAEGKVKDVSREAGDAAGDLADATKQAAIELAKKAPGYVAKGKDALEDLTDKIWKDAMADTDKARTARGSDEANDSFSELSKPPKEPIDFETFDLDMPGKPGAADPSTFGNLKASEPPAEPGKKKLLDFESDFVQNTKKKAGEVADKADKLASPTLDAAARAGLAAKEKLGDLSETVGKKVLEVGDDVLERAARTGATAKDKFGDFVVHASRESEKMRMEDAIEDAKRAAEQAEARAKAFGGKEAERDTSESTLSGTGSFFERASRFADGDYTNEGGKEMTIGRDPDATKQIKGGKIQGFDDADGDGDSLIDDAIIEEDDTSNDDRDDQLLLPELPQ